MRCHRFCLLRRIFCRWNVFSHTFDHVFLSFVSSSPWAYTNSFNSLISSAYASRSPNNFPSCCIAWKLSLIVGCWERRAAWAGPVVGDGNVSSTDRFLVFRRVTLVGVFATPALLFVLLRRVFAGCHLGVLKLAEERSSSSSSSRSLSRISVLSSASPLCPSKSISSSSNCFSLNSHACLPRLESSDFFTLPLGNPF